MPNSEKAFFTSCDKIIENNISHTDSHARPALHVQAFFLPLQSPVYHPPLDPPVIQKSSGVLRIVLCESSEPVKYICYERHSPHLLSSLADLFLPTRI